jgi:hypothetical protein
VHRYAFPRSDLTVTLDGVALKPGFALGSYAAFAPTPEGALVMGDLVLTEAEVSPVVAKLQQAGLDVTAVHNHLLREQPKVMYVHYLGHGGIPRRWPVACVRRSERRQRRLGPRGPPGLPAISASIPPRSTGSLAGRGRLQGASRSTPSPGARQ